MRTWFIDPASLDAPRNRLAESDVALHVFTESELKEFAREVFENGRFCEAQSCPDTDQHFNDYWRERMEGEK